jgi:hypothetical protein
MGPGHFGIAFAATPAAPKMPLWALLVDRGGHSCKGGHDEH